MTNPFTRLDKNVLRALMGAGQVFFVRQTFRRGEQPGVGPGHAFLLTGYVDDAQAMEHFTRLGSDGNRFLYDVRDAMLLQRLETAAAGVPGYAVYVPLLKGPWKPGKELGVKVKTYISRRLPWWPKRGEEVGAEMTVRFGEIFLILRYNAKTAEVPLSDIES